MNKRILILVFSLLASMKVFADEQTNTSYHCAEKLYSVANTWDWNYGHSSIRHTVVDVDMMSEGMMLLMEGVNEVSIDLNSCSEKVRTDLQKVKSGYQTMIAAIDAAKKMDDLFESQEGNGQFSKEMLQEWAEKRSKKTDTIFDAHDSAQELTSFVILVVTKGP